MGLPLSFNDGEVLVLDTSTVININATGRAADIIRLLPFRVVVVDVVSGELDDGQDKGRHDSAKLRALIDSGVITSVSMKEEALDHVEGLVVGPGPETLDDGEAATIAQALAMGARAIIDERKAVRICAKRFPALRLGCTVDLLAHARIAAALGPTAMADAVHRALVQARMNVLPHCMEWVVSLIGNARASTCASLPDHVRREARARS